MTDGTTPCTDIASASSQREQQCTDKARRVRFELRLTRDELEAWRAQARALGVGLADLVRAAMEHALPRGAEVLEEQRLRHRRAFAALVHEFHQATNETVRTTSPTGEAGGGR